MTAAAGAPRAPELVPPFQSSAPYAGRAAPAAAVRPPDLPDDLAEDELDRLLSPDLEHTTLS
jgi:hypothetical protein